MSNYVFYDYAKSCVAKVKEDGIEYVPSSSMNRYFNEICIRNGSTVDGRRKAFGRLMNQKHFIPIVVNTHPHEIYFPIQAVNDPENKWICYESIHTVQYEKDRCQIVFTDGSILECAHPARIKRQMHQIFRFLKRRQPL